MRKTIIAGNWKMYKTAHEAIELVTLFKRDLCDITEVDIVICPPFPALSDVYDVLNESNIALGAQNFYWEDAGAFTGEVSAPMLKDIGVQYVIIGHSERRQFFAGTNETVNKKINAALKHGLIPIVCVGENLNERENNQTFIVVEKQCEESLAGLSSEQMKKIIIAYEPVWAIGTGKTATPGQAQEVHKFIRDLLAKMHNPQIAGAVRIQYGGSVKPENTVDLISQEDIDGALVGGASLKQDSFVQIIKSCCDLKLKRVRL